MKKLLFLLPPLMASMMLGGADVPPPSGYQYTFQESENIEKDWTYKGKLIMVPATQFQIRPLVRDENARGGVLTIRANSSTGIIMIRPPVDPRKYPIVRWRWRIITPINYPHKTREPDDQAVMLYIGDGTLVRQKCVAYRWEHNYPVGDNCLMQYNGGAISVWRLCMRNRKAEPMKWYVEERNYAEDYKKAFKKELDQGFVLSISGNSQHTKSTTCAEIDYIEFLPASEAGKALSAR